MLYFEIGEIMYTEHIRQKLSRYITAPAYGDDFIDSEIYLMQLPGYLAA